VAKRQSGSQAAQRARPRRPVYPRWSEAENRVADRFARAIVSGRYPNVNQALPDCRRETGAHCSGVAANRGCCRLEASVCLRFRPAAPDAVLTDQEKRLLDSHAAALARGECPDTRTAVRQVKQAFRAGRAGGAPPRQRHS